MPNSRTVPLAPKRLSLFGVHTNAENAITLASENLFTPNSLPRVRAAIRKDPLPVHEDALRSALARSPRCYFISASRDSSAAWTLTRGRSSRNVCRVSWIATVAELDGSRAIHARVSFALGGKAGSRLLNYLFLAFDTSTAFSPRRSVLSRGAKVLMMAHSLLSLLVIAVLAARAINTS